MGAENSILDDCYLDDTIEANRECIWPRRNGEVISNETNVTIFFDQKSENDLKDLLRKNIKVRLFLDSIISLISMF